MITNQRDSRDKHVAQVAHHMMNAARTAPKSKGIDIIEIALVEGEDIKTLSNKMLELAEELGYKFFIRDGENILDSQAIVLIGTPNVAIGLNCGYCGYDKCASRAWGVPCALNSIDLGIAVGSACSMASDMKVDTRVMFSAGLAAKTMGILGSECTQVIAIAVSSSSKSPFFDRKSTR
ncbi:MAG: DUF2148 domain-containing protein [Rikenellaceae bacterium]